MRTSEEASHTAPAVSVIVLSHDRPDYLAKVLDSIVEQSHPTLEIIVVDNQSRSSDEIAQLVLQYEGVKLIRNSANLGFTGGMNKGIQAASGEYVHCTLDDILLDKDCIRHLVEYVRQQPSTGLLSGILYYEDETICCAGGEVHLTPVYRLEVFGEGKRDVGQFPEPFQVKYIPGGMIFSRLDFMKQLRGFREDFFMYSEDAELCARVAKLGRTISVVPQAKVCVLDAPHSFKSERIAFHKFKNHFSIYLLHARLRVLPEFYLRYGVVNLLRAVGSNRKIVWPMIRAWGWFLLNAPSLLRERFRHGSREIESQTAAARDEDLESATTSGA